MDPYKSLDSKSFWSSAIAKCNMFDIVNLWDPKFCITREMKVVTYGSCFAQHIGKSLKLNGFNWFISEPKPIGLNEESAEIFNYEIFSSRTGNIYTASLLKQWIGWANGEILPEEIWKKNDRFYDPFRPNIEPNGFESKEELVRSREAAIQAFKKSLIEGDILIFTLGLTESWFNLDHGYEYPICPGTIAGKFDSSKHHFTNQKFDFIRKTLNDVIDSIKLLNPKMRIILTVSPVPLTATMSGKHILVANTESKSILRTVAGLIAHNRQIVDYFPSYEMISATPFKGIFYEPNQRNVNHAGVNHVMSMFFKCQIAKFPNQSNYDDRLLKNFNASENSSIQVTHNIAIKKANCEEELLDAFSTKK